MNNVKLSTKLIGSFIIVSIIFLIFGIFVWSLASKIDNEVKEIGDVRIPSLINLMHIEKGAESIRVAQRTLLSPLLSSEDRKRQYENIKKARDEYEKAWKIYEPLPQTPEEAKIWKEFVSVWGEWRSENDTFLKLSKELEEIGILNPTELRRLLQEVRGDHYKLMDETLSCIVTNGENEITGGESSDNCNFGKWVSAFKCDNSNINGAIARIIPHHSAFHNSVKKIKNFVAIGKINEAKDVYFKEMDLAAEDVFNEFNALRTEVDKVEALYAKMSDYALIKAREKQAAALKLLNEIIKINEDVSDTSMKQAFKQASGLKILSMIGMLLTVILSLGFGIILAVSITKALNRAIGELTESSNQVVSASGQISSSSQSLAEGASEQAASLEETSASLEEMSSMTRQNADNANQADNLMKQTSKVIHDANNAMSELISSMGEISKASEETSKIIKTIDEIAFQTNLLALNAAVEAARAGEVGAGFAVVAGEVRNLAMRASEAAKNTAALIEQTVKKIKGGGEIVDKTNKAFSEVSSYSVKVEKLIGEISAASNEQAQGIEQVNKAVVEMDKVTQQNAANAEEAASASEELNAQSEQMIEIVKSLAVLVKGHYEEKAFVRDTRTRTQTKKFHAGNNAGNKPNRAKASITHQSGQKALQVRGGKREVKPNEIIPLDEDDFKDF
ncbi:MAG: MCP four helix bundle domain-containing protein [Desulfobacterales bacterium]|nr:MCP four helix bundle domain-containing protein [Desulfobacterales bacterium]